MENRALGMRLKPVLTPVGEKVLGELVYNYAEQVADIMMKTSGRRGNSEYTVKYQFDLQGVDLSIEQE